MSGNKNKEKNSKKKKETKGSEGTTTPPRHAQFPKPPVVPLTPSEKEVFTKIIYDFMENAAQDELEFPSTLSRRERAFIHIISDELGLWHLSSGKTSARVLKLMKPHRSSHQLRYDFSKQAWVRFISSSDDQNPNCNSARNQRVLKVLSFNLLMEESANTGNKYHTNDHSYSHLRRPEQYKFLQQQSADIMGFQEVTPAFIDGLLDQDWVRQHYYVIENARHTVDPVGMGDFNFKSEMSESHQILESNFIDAWPKLYPNDPGYTYDVYHNNLAGAVSESVKAVKGTTGSCSRFDRIYLRGFSATKMEILTKDPIPNPNYLQGAISFEDKPLENMNEIETENNKTKNENNEGNKDEITIENNNELKTENKNETIENNNETKTENKNEITNENNNEAKIEDSRENFEVKTEKNSSEIETESIGQAEIEKNKTIIKRDKETNISSNNNSEEKEEEEGEDENQGEEQEEGEDIEMERVKILNSHGSINPKNIFLSDHYALQAEVVLTEE